MSDPNRKMIYLDDTLKALRPIMRKSDYFYEIQKAIQDIPSAQPDNTCNGCRYERFGNRVCDQCSRFYMDRYEVKQDG